MHTVYLSLGTNLGNKEENLNSAIREIKRRIGTIKAQSAYLETEPWGFQSPNTFLNAAVRVQTELTPHALLAATQDIEKLLGRTEKTQPANGDTPVYHDRIIDIDILLYDDITIHTPALSIPHPHMYERDFVLIPLSQIQEK